jgi:hypothetical protein
VGQNIILSLLFSDPIFRPLKTIAKTSILAAALLFVAGAQAQCGNSGVGEYILTLLPSSTLIS